MNVADGNDLLEYLSSSGEAISNMSELQQRVRKQILASSVLGYTGRGNHVLITVGPQDQSSDLKDTIYTLIEESFQTIGGATGTGKKTDIYNEEIFKQLVAVNVPDCRLMGGYRSSLIGQNIDNGNLYSPMGDFFNFQPDFLEYLKNSRYLELGTAWINKSLSDRESLFLLKGLWDGIAYLADEYKSDGFIGKLTIPTQYNPDAADFSLSYLTKFFGTRASDVAIPKKDIYDYRARHTDEKLKIFDKYLQTLTGDYLQDEKSLQTILREISLASKTPGQLETRFPNMFPMYLSRISSLDYIGTVKNRNVLESGIVVDMINVHDSVKDVHFGVVEKRKKEFGEGKLSLEQYLKTML